MRTRSTAGLMLFLAALPCACAEGAIAAAERGVRSESALKDAGAAERSDVVGVISSLGGVQSICTGFVIDPRLVVTAEHCLALVPHADVSTECANATLPLIDPMVQAWVVRGASLHDAGSAAYVPVSGVRVAGAAARLCGDDIVLLELANPVPQSRTLALTATVPQSGAHFETVGYGTDGKSGGDQRENSSALILCSGETCSDARVANSELLASSGACAGDSGGPAIDENGLVFGMAARSSDDCSETAYLYMAPHLRWLAVSVTEVATADGRTAPEWVSDTLRQGGGIDAGGGWIGDRVATASGCGCELRPQSRLGSSWLATLLVAASLSVRRATASRRSCKST